MLWVLGWVFGLGLRVGVEWCVVVFGAYMYTCLCMYTIYVCVGHYMYTYVYVHISMHTCTWK